jgi:hypothetical protein
MTTTARASHPPDNTERKLDLCLFFTGPRPCGEHKE